MLNSLVSWIIPVWHKSIKMSKYLFQGNAKKSEGIFSNW